jgi:hypothetical protein
MLTDLQLTETALRIALADLNDLATYDRGDLVDSRICAEYCPVEHAHGRCDRDDDWPRETQHVHGEIKDVAAFLRQSLTQYAAARGITLPADAA